MPDMIGQRIGAYEIVSLLGSGGMSQVYRARQQLGSRVIRDVALKLIDARLSLSNEFITRFEREAQTLLTLSHPHILKAFDYGQYGETVYLVMELLPGGSLAQRIHSGMLPLSDVSKWLHQIGQALDYAHRQGIVHRDMKPQNVLFDNENNAFLSDFGIVKLLGASSSLTQSNTSIGTPAYMAPEQWTSGKVDARTDLYAFGVMLFEMLGGQVPFSGDTPFRVMYLHTNELPPSIYSLRPDLPASLDRVFSKVLSKDPNKRHESAAALIADFSAALEGSSITVLPLSPVQPAKNQPYRKTNPITGPMPNNKTVILPASKPGLPVATSAAAPMPIGRSRLPFVIGLIAAAIIAVATGGVLATLLAERNNFPAPAPVIGTVAPIASPTQNIVSPAQTVATTVQSATSVPTQLPLVIITQAATLSSTPTILTATSTPTIPTATSTPTIPTATSTPTILTATSTPTIPTATSTPSAANIPILVTLEPTTTPSLFPTTIDAAILIETVLAQALTQTATLWTPTPVFTPSPTPTIDIIGTMVQDALTQTASAAQAPTGSH